MTSHQTEQALRVLLGHDMSGVGDVLLIPLRSVYRRAAALWEDAGEMSGGFYANTVVRRQDGRRLAVVNVPQGVQAQDLCAVLTGKRIHFFGYAGSLDPAFEVGDVLEIARAVLPDGTARALHRTRRFPAAAGGYSPCLLGGPADAACAAARRAGCGVVDMEIAHCADAALRGANRFSAWVLVTDRPGDVNFWDVTPAMQARVRDGLQTVLDALREEL